MILINQLKNLYLKPIATQLQRSLFHSLSCQWNQKPLEGVKQPIKIQLNETDLIEKFVKGSGNGGQAINKTNSNVELVHIPTGIRIQCQETRSQSLNRKLARKLMTDKLDQFYNGSLSKRAMKANKVNKQKAKQRKRALKKYGKSEDKDAENEPNETQAENQLEEIKN